MPADPPPATTIFAECTLIFLEFQEHLKAQLQQ